MRNINLNHISIEKETDISYFKNFLPENLTCFYFYDIGSSSVIEFVTNNHDIHHQKKFQNEFLNSFPIIPHPTHLKIFAETLSKKFCVKIEYFNKYHSSPHHHIYCVWKNFPILPTRLVIVNSSENLPYQNLIYLRENLNENNLDQMIDELQHNILFVNRIRFFYEGKTII